MSKFYQTRICSVNDYGKWTIHQFGYDENGNYRKKTSKFEPFFYALKEDLNDVISTQGFQVLDRKTYFSPYGDECIKVNYRNSKSRKNFVDTHRTFEADVQPEISFMNQNEIEWSYDRHILFYDIETDVDLNNPNANKPEQADMPITSIQIYSTETKQYYVFSWHPTLTSQFDEIKIEKQGDIIYFLAKTEEEVLLSFINFVHDSKCDILAGWYCGQYDMPYIINRSKKLGIEPNGISPINHIWMKKVKDVYRIYINGIDHIDMLDAIQSLNYNLSNYKLSTASKEILGDGEMEKLTEVTWRDWRDNFKGFIQYGIRDVEILHKIADKLNMFPLFYSLQEFANLKVLSDVFFKSVVVDFYLLKEYRNQYVFPTKKGYAKKKYKGAIVIDPVEPGLHKDVFVTDFTSLYPTSIMAFNISPDSFITSQELCEEDGLTIEDVISKLNEEGIDFIDTGYDEELLGKRYLFYSHSQKPGLLPISLRKIFNARKDAQREMKNYSESSAEYLALDRKQWTYKIVLNSAYGAMGFNYFRMYRPECADAVTYFARICLKYSVMKFNSWGNKVIYVDTDSNFIKANGDSIDDIKSKLNDFNQLMTQDVIQHFNPNIPFEFNYMDLKFEKDLSHIYFGNKKKRYYGINRVDGKKYIRGINIIRKDTPEFMKKTLNMLVEMAVRDQFQIDHLIKVRSHLETVSYKDLGISKKFTKPFSDYDKTMPQHVKGATFANKFLGTNITHIDTPYLFYIKSKCEDELKPKDRNKAICLNLEDLDYISTKSDIFEIDYDTFFDKQVLKPLSEFEFITKVKSIIKTYKETINK